MAISFWFDTLPSTPARASLQQELNVDVAIIGAGFTGLWTAYYLKQQAPQLSVAIVEAEQVGFGASGRNGGWLIGGIAGEGKYLARLEPEACRAGYRQLYGIIDEVERVLEREQIDCDLARGGMIYAAARYPEQLKRIQSELRGLHADGHTEEDFRWMDADELSKQMRMHNGYGGIYSPHCAVIQPGKLVRGLADCVERLGVQILENSPVTAVEGTDLRTAQGRLRASILVPATEGFSDSLMGINRYVLPVQSLIIATEPLAPSQWEEIGMERRPAFSDGGRLTTYGHRSADNRLIFGARGGYCFGGKVRHRFSLSDPEFRLREELMRELFPPLQQARVTHGWGGSLGMARNFAPFALFDPATGIASAGGYGGEGVGATNLFGRTLADLILGQESERTRMPWVFTPASHRQALRRWEPEPIRWLTYRTILSLFSWEDRLYRRQSGPSLLKTLAGATCQQLERLIH
ncbi:NAD(P)/FAD-dependent oxidoreductase [Aestuariirhabdus litorea]|uniref:FAD-dependent oxidoreductase n=1 Tax=Aestuariirhabdus litorea TaxID=2528527 RepID=A0A3P3VTH7_9GAMM|nr:FAD-binding oxidoreductase [Aestuariirhabdus litorea]RRJ84063.1 FAD-dependent oxidoreductase [Aestuariirhabdus litorea]RWW97283.1 FAD-dependent oxidoreductase [Endozoicomonadaceae bacterium GTF-13]